MYTFKVAKKACQKKTFFSFSATIFFPASIQLKAPTSAPQSLTATPFSTNITIQWDRISCLNQNSEITRYILRYGLTMSNQTTTITVYGTNDNERVFTANRLEPLTMYTFEVAGVNRNGQISPYTTVSRSTTAPEGILN